MAIFFTAGIRWPLNSPRTIILPFLNSTPGLLLQILFSQSFIKSVDIYPWIWHVTIIPVASYSFSIALYFHITYRSNTRPSLNTADITVSSISSFTKALIVVDFVPTFSMIQWMLDKSKSVLLFGSTDNKVKELRIFPIDKKNTFWYNLKTTLLAAFDFLLWKVLYFC